MAFNNLLLSSIVICTDWGLAASSRWGFSWAYCQRAAGATVIWKLNWLPVDVGCWLRIQLEKLRMASTYGASFRQHGAWVTEVASMSKAFKTHKAEVSRHPVTWQRKSQDIISPQSVVQRSHLIDSTSTRREIRLHFLTWKAVCAREEERDDRGYL